MADTIIGLPLDALLAGTETEAPSLGCSAEEARLIAGLRDGTDSAYELLIDRYQHSVYNLICRLLGESSEAADITQEVFLKIFRNIVSFRERSSLRTWIYRIAVNEAYNHRRWYSRHQRQEVSPPADHDGQPNTGLLPAHDRSPFELVSDGEMRAIVERALETLNPKFRAAVVLRDIEEMRYEEIATVLGVSIGTVKSRILRGREALRRALASGQEPERGVTWVQSHNEMQTSE
ncbi:MAG TPA: sigma-70 family RNA polymerase sigma factor [Bryobacteraceae bacterium]|jgi:RNA polymerase sigma-70 factor (ECF subfamily)|nr:sigma-70 family RNA polymerase sigma factor [Bryobacteraceae bacterium]